MLHIPHDTFVASRRKLVLHDSRAAPRDASADSAGGAASGETVGGLDPAAHQRVRRLADLLTRSGAPAEPLAAAAPAIRFLRRARPPAA